MVPFMATDLDADDRCLLHCRTYDNYKNVWKTNGQAEHERYVPDGTACRYDDPHGPICIQGKCVNADCERNDKRTGTKRVDNCGVCDGDNTSCEHITDKKTKK